MIDIYAIISQKARCDEQNRKRRPYKRKRVFNLSHEQKMRASSDKIGAARELKHKYEYPFSYEIPAIPAIENKMKNYKVAKPARRQECRRHQNRMQQQSACAQIRV